MDPQPADVAKGYVGLELQRRSGIARQGRHRAGLGGTDRRSSTSARASISTCRGWSRRAAIRASGTDRADQGGDARRAGLRRAQGAAAHRPAARPGPPGRRRRQGLRVPRRLDLAHHRHPVPVGEGQADEHRPGGGADGRHAGRRDQRAGALPRAERPAAAGDQACPRGQVRHRAAAGGRPAGAAGDAASWGEYFVPVLAANADEPFLLELRYTVSGDGSSLELPVFSDDDVAVQKVYLCVYLPADAGAAGAVPAPGTRSSSGSAWSPGLKWEASPSRDSQACDDKKLVSWVEEGTGPAGSAAGGSFLPDGRRYVFSTLRPAAGGALRLSLLSDRGLNAIVFLVVMFGGLLLLPAGLGRRALAVGAGIIALVLAGVFYPTFSDADSQRGAGGGRFHRAGGVERGVPGMDAAGGLGPAAVRPRRRSRCRRPWRPPWTPGLPEPPAAESPPAAPRKRPRSPPSPRAKEARPMRNTSAAWSLSRMGLAPSAARCLPSSMVCVLAICLGAAGTSSAQETNPPEKVREIFVPFKDLNILLENQPRRVLLSRQQYDELVKKAKIAPARHVPQAAVLTAADYSGRSDGQRVRHHRHAGHRRAGEGPASRAAGPRRRRPALGEARRSRRAHRPHARRRLRLLVEGMGRHALVLEMVAPLETTAARQLLFLRLPRAAAGRLHARRARRRRDPQRVGRGRPHVGSRRRRDAVRAAPRRRRRHAGDVAQ